MSGHNVLQVGIQCQQSSLSGNSSRKWHLIVLHVREVAGSLCFRNRKNEALGPQVGITCCSLNTKFNAAIPLFMR